MTIDKDLQFFQLCKKHDLITLCDILTKKENGNKRLTEKLTKSENYLRFYPQDISKMWADIAVELQRYGGNTLVDYALREGRGPSYEEILSTVCRHAKITLPVDATCAEMEQKFLERLLDCSLSNLSDGYLRQVCERMDISCISQLPKTAIMEQLLLTRKKDFKVYLTKLRQVLGFIQHRFVDRMQLMREMFFLPTLLNIFGPVVMTSKHSTTFR